MGQQSFKKFSLRAQISPRSRKLVWFASTAYVPSIFLTNILPLQVSLIVLGGIGPAWAGECSVTDITGCGASGGLGVPGRSGNGGTGNGQGGGSSHIDGNGDTIQDAGNWGGNGAGGNGAQGDGGASAP